MELPATHTTLLGLRRAMLADLEIIIPRWEREAASGLPHANRLLAGLRADRVRLAAEVERLGAPSSRCLLSFQPKGGPPNDG